MARFARKYVLPAPLFLFIFLCSCIELAMAVCTASTGRRYIQGRSQGRAQGARAPPLSCRAITSYKRCLATHVVTLAGSCKLEFTLLELLLYHAAHEHGFTPASFSARGKPRYILKKSLIIGCDLRSRSAAQYLAIEHRSRLSKSNKREASVYIRHTTRARRGIFWKLS